MHVFPNKSGLQPLIVLLVFFRTLSHLSFVFLIVLWLELNILSQNHKENDLTWCCYSSSWGVQNDIALLPCHILCKLPSSCQGRRWWISHHSLFPINAIQAISSTEKLFGLFVRYLSICLILDQNYYFLSTSFLYALSIILSSLICAAFCDVQL